MFPQQTKQSIISDSWKQILSDNFNSASFKVLNEFLKQERREYVIFPPEKETYSAFNKTPFNNVKVVILGQDPYHGKDQANGMCFSVNHDIKIPPSLLNIFKELKSDLNIDLANQGDLSNWAEEGVLLLNTVLTVRESEPGSHQGKGWEDFTNSVIMKLSEKCSNLVFILWGRFAQAKASLIDDNKHLILTAAHPSPLSAYNGFFGCKHFSKTNEYLVQHGKKPINWDINK